MKRLVLIVCGGICLALGAVGIIVPVLPTTPFVLLAAGCFSAGSPRAYQMLCRNRLFGPYIEHYKNGGGITQAARVRGIIMLWVLLIISAVAVWKLWLVPVLGAVGIGVRFTLCSSKHGPALSSRTRRGRRITEKRGQARPAFFMHYNTYMLRAHWHI